MKFTNYSFIFVFLFCLTLLCCSTPQEETEVAEPETIQLSDEDITAINKTIQGYIQACLDGNWDLAVSYFTEDAIRMPMNSPTEQGLEAIRAHFDVVDNITEWTVHSSEIKGECGIAHVRYSFSITAVLKGMSKPISYTGKQLGILRKQEDGSWLYIMDIWNSDAPMQ